MMRRTQGLAVVVALFASSSAYGIGAIAVGVGNRVAGFEIAPGNEGRSMTLTELAASFASDPLLVFPTGVLTSGVALKLGATVAYQSMRGGLGSGLDEFSGLSYGPDLKTEIGLGRFTPFVKLAYRMGRYEGRGSVNWGGDEVPAAFLYRESVNEVTDKNFASAGAHGGGGCAFEIVAPRSSGGIAAAATAEVDFGFEDMATDTRVIDGTVERSDRTDGGFDSVAVLFGGVVGF